MLKSQLVAVLRDTALARILDGKISAGYVHDVGPHVVEKVATKRYEQATMAQEAWRFCATIHVVSLFCTVLVSGVFGRP